MFFSIFDIQQKYNEIYKKRNEDSLFPHILTFLYNEGKCIDSLDSLTIPKDFDIMDPKDFEKLKKSFYFEFPIEDFLLDKNISTVEHDFFTDKTNVIALYIFNHSVPTVHAHKDFEIDYIIEGECTFIFEGETKHLTAGDFLIITPKSNHDLILDNEQTLVIPIVFNSKTFQLTTGALLFYNNTLGDFFKSTKTDFNSPNYIVFKTRNQKDLQYIAKNLFIESFRYDEHANFSSIQWLNLLFVNIMRNSIDSYQFNEKRAIEDFAPIIIYIQENYRTVTLKDVANKFNYSCSRLSQLIKNATGKTFSEWNLEIKMRDAEPYIINTNKSISEISNIVGYNNTDHFSRTFKSYYGISPLEYRNNYLNTFKKKHR